MPQKDRPSAVLKRLRARYVFPIAGPPIPDAVATVSEGRILAVESSPSAPDIEDLGNVAILPGLVNAHTHLELSDFAAPVGEPGIGMVDWIRRVIAHRRSQGEPSGSVVRRGLAESLRLGTTTVGDIAQPGWPMEALRDTPCDVTIFQELISPTLDRVSAALDLARGHLKAPGDSSGVHIGLSPHAPYSVHPALLRQSVELSAAHRVPLAFHLAESREEIEWLRTGGGPFDAFLQDLKAWDPTAVVPGRRAIDFLRILSQAHRTLVIHGNYLNDEEIAFLAENCERMAVVYCPRTHERFGHEAYPLEKLLAAGVPMALGTDSRASSPDLSLLAEIRTVARRHPAIRPDVAVRLGTLGGAAALGRSDIGTLEPGQWANLAVVPLVETKSHDPYELLLGSETPVLRTYYHGEL